jgi:hypothetical protein
MSNCNISAAMDEINNNNNNNKRQENLILQGCALERIKCWVLGNMVMSIWVLQNRKYLY